MRSLKSLPDAASQLVTNLSRSAERIQSFKQVALDQSQSKRRSFDPGPLTEQVLSIASRTRFEAAVHHQSAPTAGLTSSMDSYPGPLGQVLTHLVVNAMTRQFAEEFE